MTDNVEGQVRELNELLKVRLAPSKIHGVGVFATRDIAIGEKLYADTVPLMFTLTFDELKDLRPEVREIVLEQFPNIINDSHFAYPTTRVQAFLNHSDQPNYNAKDDIVITDIKAGDEVTEDYREIENADKVFPWLSPQ